MKKKVFISFDYDNDKTLKDLLVGQCKLDGSPFEIVDYSLKEECKESNWEEKAKSNIIKADLLIVMLGKHTHKAPGVLKEVKMAKELNKKIIQVIGYQNVPYKRLKNCGKLYRWKWENLKKVLN